MGWLFWLTFRYLHVRNGGEFLADHISGRFRAPRFDI